VTGLQASNKKEPSVFQKLRNITPKNKRGSTSDKKKVLNISKIRNTPLKEKGLKLLMKKRLRCFKN
jgi:hypothetical protein